MAQDPSNSGGASYTLDDVTFPVGRSKLQSIFNAVRSTNKGSSAPDLVAGQFWIDDSGGSSWIMYFYDGSNNIQFATIDTSANTVNFTDSAFDLIVDTTPQLGGNLDVNGNAIVSASNGNITITPDGSGKVILDGISHPTADGSNGQVLTTNGAGVLSFTDKTVDTTNLVADTSPQLGGDLDLNSNDITGTGNINFTGNVVLTGTVDGRDIAADGAKLDGVEASATADQTASEIRSLVDSATDSNVFTDADHTKLNGIEASATADQTDAEIRTAVESATDSNVFTDADHTKLNGIETGATADQTSAEIKTAVEAESDIALAGNPTATTQTAGNNTTRIATTAFVQTATAALVDSAPSTLDTLNELASALGDDANFSTTVSNNIATKLPLAGGTMTGNIVMNSTETVDGRDLSVDGAKLDGIEASATADQTAAEIRTLVDSATDSNVFTDADHTKLNAIEASADVTDTANVTAAGALMDSEVTNLADVKSFDTADYATAAQGTLATNALPKSGGTMTGNIVMSGTETVDGRDLSADGSKLDGIEASATADQTGAEIKTAYEGEADTNAFTDALLTKLNGIETSADVTDATNVDAAGAIMNSDVATKGQLIVGDGSGDPTILSVGADGLYLKADSTASSGVAWASVSGGGSSIGGATGVDFDDNVKVRFGTGNDLELYHDGNDSYIHDGGTGTLIIRGSTAVRITNTGGDNMFVGNDGGGAELYHNGTKVVETSGNGLEMGDNLELRIGDGADLKIFHENTNNHSVIKEDGGGHLKLQAENLLLMNPDATETYIECVHNGSTQLYHDNSKKLETASTGITVTGEVDATSFDGILKSGISLESNAFHQTSDGIDRLFFANNAETKFNGTNSVDFRVNGTDRARIDSAGTWTVTGNVTAFGSISDENKKENIEIIPDALNKISELKGVTFNYIKDGKRSTGLIAQDLEKVLPEVVYEATDLEDKNDKFKAVNYGNTVGLLVEGIKELKERNEKLEMIVTKLITDIEEKE